MMGPQDGSTHFEAQAHGDGGWGLILRARIIPRTSVGEAGKNESRMQKLETLVHICSSQDRRFIGWPNKRVVFKKFPSLPMPLNLFMNLWPVSIVCQAISGMTTTKAGETEKRRNFCHSLMFFQGSFISKEMLTLLPISPALLHIQWLRGHQKCGLGSTCRGKRGQMLAVVKWHVG